MAVAKMRQHSPTTPPSNTSIAVSPSRQGCGRSGSAVLPASAGEINKKEWPLEFYVTELRGSISA